MPILSFGEWRPDVSDYRGQTTTVVKNVIPRGDGYGPFAGLAGFTTALPAACRGMFLARKNDGTISIFAGTSTKLYQLNNSTNVWTDVSLGGGTYTALSSTDNWQFAQTNNIVYAVQGNAVPQSFDLTSSTAFANLAGTPPQAKYVAVVNRFLVLTGITSNSPPTVYRVQWSGLNAFTTWDNVTNQSNFQDLADGGIVRGVAGGEYGVIFQDNSIRRMTYSPGSPYIFGIDRVSLDDGIFGPYSLISGGDRVFFCSPQGFKMLLPGGYPQAIGKERVDRTFFADIDQTALNLFIGAHDPQQPRVLWGYKSKAGAAGAFDTILCYDWLLDRWSKVSLSGEFFAALSQPGTTLEGVDAVYGTGTPTALTSISNASPAVFTLTAHGLTVGQGINLTTTGTLPAGLSVNTPYYVKSTGFTANSFQVSATGGVGALEGAAVNTSSAGSGTHSFSIPSEETLSIASLDSISNASRIAIAAVDSTNTGGFFTGANLEATLQTPEEGVDLIRGFVRSLRPITDSGAAMASLVYRENATLTPTTGPESAINATGVCPQRVSTRYARGKLRIPAGSSWTFAAGVEPDVAKEGER